MEKDRAIRGPKNTRIKKYFWDGDIKAEPKFTLRCVLPGDGVVIQKIFYRWVDIGELIYACDGYKIDKIIIIADLSSREEIKILMSFLDIHKEGFPRDITSGSK